MLWTADFWFKVEINGVGWIDKVLLAGSLLVLVFAVAFSVWAKLDKQPIRKALLVRLSALSYTFSLLAVAWFWLRYENIAWLGSRAAFLVILLACAVWKWFIFKYWFFRYKKDVQSWEHQQVKDKYLTMKK